MAVLASLKGGACETGLGISIVTTPSTVAREPVLTVVEGVTFVEVAMVTDGFRGVGCEV